jgi:DNA-binding MarR family transcriptional regulator
MENTQIEVILKIKILNKILEQDFLKRLEEKELTPQQGRILLFICDHYEKIEISQNLIETTFDLSKSTVSGLIKRLTNKELIKIKKVKNTNLLFPTQNGLDIKKYFVSQREETFKRLCNNLSDDEINNMIRQLDILINNFKKEDKQC